MPLEDNVTLFKLCIDVLVRYPERLTVEKMYFLPESVSVQLFESLLAAGKLNPRLLTLFERVECFEVLNRIEMLGIDTWLPPLVKGEESCTINRRVV